GGRSGGGRGGGGGPLSTPPAPLAGGVHRRRPPPHLDALAEAVRRSGADLGLATDGDGDRLGVVAADGRYVTPHAVLALLTRHLVQQRRWRGDGVKGCAAGVPIGRVCARPALAAPATPSA